MILSILFSTFLFPQSFSEKPEVPVFHIDGKNYVRVDCWEESNIMNSYYLPQTNHPKVFNTSFELNLYSKMFVEVSMLRAENTLTMTKFEGETPVFEVQTYGAECGYKTYNESLYCSIFEGEIFENWILSSTKKL